MDDLEIATQRVDRLTERVESMITNYEITKALNAQNKRIEELELLTQQLLYCIKHSNINFINFK